MSIVEGKLLQKIKKVGSMTECYARNQYSRYGINKINFNSPYTK